jgi:hypothetical protein
MRQVYPTRFTVDARGPVDEGLRSIASDEGLGDIASPDVVRRGCFGSGLFALYRLTCEGKTKPGVLSLLSLDPRRPTVSIRIDGSQGNGYDDGIKSHDGDGHEHIMPNGNGQLQMITDFDGQKDNSIIPAPLRARCGCVLEWRHSPLLSWLLLCFRIGGMATFTLA